MTCVFAVLCIPGVVYQLTLWPLITALYCGWTLWLCLTCDWSVICG